MMNPRHEARKKYGENTRPPHYFQFETPYNRDHTTNFRSKPDK